MYKLRYLPSTKQDISKIVLYISEHLKDIKAAVDLVDVFDKSIHDLNNFHIHVRYIKALYL